MLQRNTCKKNPKRLNGLFNSEAGDLTNVPHSPLTNVPKSPLNVPCQTNLNRLNDLFNEKVCER